MRAGLIVLILAGGLGLAEVLGWDGPGLRIWGMVAGAGLMLLMAGTHWFVRRSSGVRSGPGAPKIRDGRGNSRKRG